MSGEEMLTEAERARNAGIIETIGTVNEREHKEMRRKLAALQDAAMLLYALSAVHMLIIGYVWWLATK